MNIKNNINENMNFKDNSSNIKKDAMNMEKLSLEIEKNQNNVIGFLDNCVAKNNALKKVQHGIYQYKNYYILHGMDFAFEDDIEGYKIAEKTGVDCAPKLFKTIKYPSNEMTTIIELKNSDGILNKFDDKINSLNLIERLNILNEFKQMLYCDYMNIGAIESTQDWRLDNNNKLILLSWNNLKRVTEQNEKNNILNQVKEYLKISDAISPNIFIITE